MKFKLGNSLRIHIFLFLSLFAAKQVFAENCTDLMEKIMKSKTIKKQNTLMYLSKHGVTEEEILEIQQYISLPRPLNKQLRARLLEFIKDLRSFKGMQKTIGHEAISELLSPHYKQSNNPHIKGFLKRQAKLDQFEQKIYQKELKANLKKTSQIKLAKKRARFSAREKRLLYQEFSNSCKLGNQSEEMKLMTKKLTYVYTGVNVSSNIGSYSYVNWDKEKNSTWGKEISFTVAFSLITSFINSHFLLANPNLSPWRQRLPLAFLVEGVEDMGVASSYNYLFSPKEKEQLALLKKKIGQENLDNFMQDLLHIMKEENLFEKHQSSAQELFKNVDGHKVDFHNLKYEDLDIQKSKEILLEALTHYVYEKNEGLIKSGSIGADRFLFHRAYNLASVPVGVGSMLVMSRILCMNQNPKIAMAKMIAFYSAVRVTMDALYYRGKREVIGQ